ncbi:uncharacterized protein LOC130821362 isoform X1 [Amaranthus tricolor]|uniref:uncharacterized protein LOC130821362 isoform X1 n=2 Tax=Amaranthus tricolor TaxID=29722 RepID=UPI0025858DB1|nr:uncharacterized protein LOC130821362 isoform X1 [Amaranthus tricolor]
MLKPSNGTDLSMSASNQHVNSNNTTPPPVQDKVQEGEAGAGNEIAGYIFMCNAETKPECFVYRVFGVPASRIGVIQRIKPNTKLFLFDFDAKLLYGIYVAESSGNLAIEPYAFGGRFPAQVKFTIARDCLPLPELAFKDAIKENYYSVSKFKQELNGWQVNELVSRFRPIFAPSSPKQSSLAFHGGVGNLYHKYMEPSQQVTSNGSAPEAPQVALARGYFGQNQMTGFTMAPPSSMLPQTLSASHWVAVAAKAPTSEGQVMSLRNESGVRHARVSYNSSDTRGVGYGHQIQGYPDSSKAVSGITDQAVNGRPVHAYETHPQSASPLIQSGTTYQGVYNTSMPVYETHLHPPNSYYTQTQGVSTVPQTPIPGSNGLNVVDSYSYYNSQVFPAPMSVVHGDVHLSQTQPSVNSGVGVDNSYQYYYGTDAASLTYDYGNQMYYSAYQPAAVTNVQDVSSNPAPVPVPGSEMYQTYWTAPPV